MATPSMEMEIDGTMVQSQLIDELELMDAIRDQDRINACAAQNEFPVGFANGPNHVAVRVLGFCKIRDGQAGNNVAHGFNQIDDNDLPPADQRLENVNPGKREQRLCHGLENKYAMSNFPNHRGIDWIPHGLDFGAMLGLIIKFLDAYQLLL